MMKKVLLTAAAVTALSSSTVLAAEGDFYAKVNGGVNFLNNVELNDTTNTTAVKTKFKRDGITGYAQAGAGYYLMDNFRVEASIGYLFNGKYKLDTAPNATDITNAINAYKITGADASKSTLTEELKYTSIVPMVSAYFDLVKTDMVDVFVGAGVGAAFTDAKLTKTLTANDANDKNVVTGTQTVDFGRKTQFAWKLAAGVAVELTEGIKAEVEVNYGDFGSPKQGTKVTSTVSNDKATKIADADVKRDLDNARGFGVLAGVRFSF